MSERLYFEKSNNYFEFLMIHASLGPSPSLYGGDQYCFERRRVQQ